MSELVGVIPRRDRLNPSYAKCFVCALPDLTRTNLRPCARKEFDSRRLYRCSNCRRWYTRHLTPAFTLDRRRCAHWPTWEGMPRVD